LYRLCYIDRPWAYFTTRRPFADQWGDDWDDAPYEHNAGEPYCWLPGVSVRVDGVSQRLQNPEPKWDVAKVAFESDLAPPCEMARFNSPWSVQMINAGEQAWLLDPKYGHRPESERWERVAEAGMAFEDFSVLIVARGGRIYQDIGQSYLACV